MEIKYPKSLSIYHPTRKISGTVNLNRSKSISNRVLIIQALCKDSFHIKHLSDSDDTQTLLSLLTTNSETYDAHHAGTTCRFLTSYLATKEGDQSLTGSDRMKQRPIGPLVEALKQLGASIKYLEKDGYPPLKISGPPKEWNSEVTLSADTSSQYITSLMMIAPTLPDGLQIHLEGKVVSKPYLDMTAEIMRYFGVNVEWQNDSIIVPHGAYKARDFTVEADWSAASYFYAMVAMIPDAEMKLAGLFTDSLQGDSALVDMFKPFGVTTTFDAEGATIKNHSNNSPFWEYDFLMQPDLAQTMAVLCGALGTKGLFSGLQTLRIKETDRIEALKSELSKFQVYFSAVPQKFAKRSDKSYFMIDGEAQENEDASIHTYKDHRMAMAFAPLALLFKIHINDPGVVSKSYPLFWKDLESLGFLVESH